MMSFFHAIFSAFSALTHGAIVLAAVVLSVLSVYSVYSQREPCPISCYINPISIRSAASRL